MIIDPRELTGLTQQAIEDARRESERIERERLAAEKRQRLADQLKAESIIAQIPERARNAAKGSQSYALVMSLRERADFDSPAGNQEHGVCHPCWLKGSAKLVWDACTTAGLSPKLQYWYNDSGDSGFNIVIHWSDSQPSRQRDSGELSQLVRQAVEEGQQEAERKQRELAEARERELQAERVLADSIIAQIPERARTAARARQSYAIVMSLREGTDYRRPLGHKDWSFCSESWLSGAARLVWDACLASNLRPELQYWYDGGGMDSGFNLVIHW